MSNVLSKFFTSLSLDKPPGPPGSKDLEFLRIHRALSGGRVDMKAPPDLHDDVMRAIIPARHPRRVLEFGPGRRLTGGVRAAMGTLGFSLVIACLGLLFWPAGTKNPLEGLNTASQTFVVATDLPGQIRPLTPLENELDLLTQDLASFVNHVRESSPL